MYEKITESDLFFMEMFYSPDMMIECLIPENINNPDEWKNADCKLLKLRPYQFSLISYDMLYANDYRKSEKENFKFKKGAGDIINIAGRNLGKCEYFENECQLANGDVVKFGNLINQQAIVLSYNEETMQLEQDLATFSDNGKKPCYRIILKSGKEITVTENHPLLTNLGWLEAKDINTNLLIATPKGYGELGTEDVDENIAKILGYIIGDGGCSGTMVRFTNINEKIIKEIYELADYFDCKLNKLDITYSFSNKEQIRNERGFLPKNQVTNICKKYGILGHLSKEKVLSKEIFNWKNKYIAILLNRVFACDGHFNKLKDGFIQFEITLASKKLVYQIQALLLRFGIHSTVHYKKSKCGDKYFDAWRLHVLSDCQKLIDEIGAVSKTEGLSFSKSYSTSDFIPFEIVDKDIKTLNAEIKRELKDKRKYGYSRFKIEQISKKYNYKKLNDIVNSNVFWEKIKEIKYVGVLPTVVVEVKKNHNYISNNIISHNSAIGLVPDAILRIIYDDGSESCIASFDEKHLKSIAEKVANVAENHKFFEMYALDGQKKSVARNPHNIRTKTGHVQIGINEQVHGKNPGTAFHGSHYKSISYDEFSYASQEGTKKRIDSGSSVGYIERYFGIPELKVGSPLGDMLSDKSKKKFICRLPQFVRPDWDEDQKAKMVKEYGGEQSYEYKVNVVADLIEGGEGKYDIERIKTNCWNYEKRIKFFEISKDDIKEIDSLEGKEKVNKAFEIFSKKIIIERLPSDKILVASDIGTTGSPSEVVFCFQINNRWRYEYQISLFKMTVKEQALFFTWVYDLMGNCIISLDCNSAEGRSIRDELIVEYKIPQEHLSEFASNKTLEVDFLKDDSGKIKRDRSGKPLVRTENTLVWGIQCLEKMMYSGEIEIPHDEKFLKEFSQYLEIKTGNRVRHSSTTTDHLHDSFILFALAAWENENKHIVSRGKKRRVLGVIS